MPVANPLRQRLTCAPVTTVPQVRLQLAPHGGSCREARQAVKAFCTDNGIEALTQDGELLTSELVANAVEHSNSEILLVMTDRTGVLTVSVCDRSSAPLGPIGRLPDDLAERGRGTFVVATVAGEWGTAPCRHGVCVWFRLP